MVVTTALFWWILIQLFGLAALPLTFCLFSRLPDRGYTLARPLGLLLVGYLLWLGGSLGFWKNSVGATVVALVLVGGVGWWLYVARLKSGDISLSAWARTHRTYVTCVEMLFGLALLGWTIFKAHNPNIETTGGEKWMEIAFVNATLRSEHFPPQDPWLSGYAISYYYFGYVLMAMMTRLSGLPVTVAYNLFVPTLFALTLSSAFGLLYNLVQESNSNLSAPVRAWIGMFYGLVGSIFVGVIGNLEGFLEVLHSRGLLPASFWQWLDIKDINVAPPLEGSWIPTRFMWWWRASRVIHDCSLQGLATGNCNPPGGDWEVIDEFPFFSFLLGDVHPHVLALPFVLLSLGLILNTFIGASRAGQDAEMDPPDPVGIDSGIDSEERHRARAKAAEILAQRLARPVQEIFGGWPGFILVAVCLGGLGFLNTWDFPIYLAVMSVAIAAAGAQRKANWASQALTMGGALGLLGIGLYVPFYIGFQSQAGGLLPNLFNPTKVQQFFVFFGPFLFAIVSYLMLISSQQRWRLHWGRLPPLILITVVAPIAAMLTMVGGAAVSPGLRLHMDGILHDPHIHPLLGQPSIGSLMLLALRLHLGNPWTWLLLSGLLIWIALIWPSPRSAADYSVQATPFSFSDRFVLLMTIFGLALPLIVEFVYLRDNFGIRMNTVFKFYYQAWILLAISAAYGIWAIHGHFLRARPSPRSERRSTPWQLIPRGLWGLVMVCLALAGLIYPILSIPSKVAYYEDEPQLDGMKWLSEVYPGDYAAIRWLQANVPGEAVILEVPGDRYAAYDYVGRVSALTGLATLLGWGNHEHQWRGSYELPARREPDIEALFNGLDLSRTTALLDQYDITYVYVGTLERKRYRADGLAKFEHLMEAVYRQGDVVIYRRR